MPILQKNTKIDAEHFHINALFFQPTYWCALDCEKCYVKGMEKNTDPEVLEGLNNNIHGSLYRLNDLLTVFTNNVNKTEESDRRESYWANQVTIAVDNLSKDEAKSKTMSYFFGWVISRFYSLEEYHYERPELHLTCNSIDTLNEYIDLTGTEKMMNVVSVMTFSFLTVKDIPKLVVFRNKYPGIHINWNFTVFNEKWLSAEMSALKEIEPYVDTIYYVMHKPALGDNLDRPKTKMYFDALPKMKSILGDAFRKVNIDGCVSDAKKWRDTGFGCASNVSRFQVWPDGSVSGCPYQQRPQTSAADNFSDIIENLRTAAKRYEFDNCKIPETLHPTSERGIRRLTGKSSGNSRLRIID